MYIHTACYIHVHARTTYTPVCIRESTRCVELWAVVTAHPVKTHPASELRALLQLHRFRFYCGRWFLCLTLNLVWKKGRVACMYVSKWQNGCNGVTLWLGSDVGLSTISNKACGFYSRHWSALDSLLLSDSIAYSYFKLSNWRTVWWFVRRVTQGYAAKLYTCRLRSYIDV